MSDVETEETFGEWVLKQRKSLGISRNVLGDSVGVSSEYIRRIELGLNVPSIAVRAALVSGLSNENDLAAMRSENQVSGRINKTFSAWVLKRRESLGMSRKALGDRVGVSSEYIRRIEHGRHKPSAAIRVALDAVLIGEKTPDERLEADKQKLIADLTEDLSYLLSAEVTNEYSDAAKAVVERIIKEGWRPSGE